MKGIRAMPVIGEEKMRRVALIIAVLFMSQPSAGLADASQACGGIAGIQCGDKEWCKTTPDNLCGIGDTLGVCQPRPEACTKMYLPVCGCDGMTYPNACEANGNGASVAYVGTCRVVDATVCPQVISCGTKDGAIKEYPTPCAAIADGAKNVSTKGADGCPVLQ